MNKKIIIPIVVIGVAVLAVVVITNKRSAVTKPAAMNTNVSNQRAGNINSNAPLKEFIMTSFVKFVDGKPQPQFSLKEITVNKGDWVRIKITNTQGTHDFKIDEIGVFADTPLNQEVLVEFTADKAGEFVYYCTKPGHRANGQWGTLRVLE